MLGGRDTRPKTLDRWGITTWNEGPTIRSLRQPAPGHRAKPPPLDWTGACQRARCASFAVGRGLHWFPLAWDGGIAVSAALETLGFVGGGGARKIAAHISSQGPYVLDRNVPFCAAAHCYDTVVPFSSPGSLQSKGCP